MTAIPDDERTRRSGLWSFPDRQDLGFTMLLGGVGAAMYGLSTVGYPHTVAPLALAAGGAVLADRGWHKWRHLPAETEPEMDMDLGMGMDPMMMGMPNWGGPEGYVPEQVSRLIEVVRATWSNGELLPEWDAFEMNGENLVAYTLRATEPGYFTNDGTRTRTMNKLTAALPATEGAWACSFDNQADTVTVTQKSSIPKLAIPPNWPVVADAKAALVRYNDWEMVLGPGENGKFVTYKPQVFPHVAVIATSGGGKSVFLRSCASQMLAIGGMLILGDGKGSDYSTLRDVPGVVAIGRGSGSKGVEYIAAIELAFRIMQQRQNTAAERKAADPEGWRNLPPVFLILDELKSVLKKWSTELDGKSFKAIESKVNQILALGREMRVHALTASQDAYAESIPASWLTNIGMKISLGKPHHMTLTKAFDESIRGDASRIAAGIDPNVRGRGMIAGVDEDSGTASVHAYQGFIGYSPGEAMPGFFNDEQRAQWNSFKDAVYGKIPHLYSRKWFLIDHKPEAQEKMESAKGEDLGYINFELFSVDELSSLQVINLDMRDDEGRIVPNPDMLKYDPDPANPHYVCKPVVNTKNTITEI